jgi:hypothetical protein
MLAPLQDLLLHLRRDHLQGLRNLGRQAYYRGLGIGRLGRHMARQWVLVFRGKRKW